MNYILESLPRLEEFGGGKWQNGSSTNITQNREFVWIGQTDQKINYIDLAKPKSVAPELGRSEPDQANPGKGRILIFVL